jgi:hypothetical protein
MAQAARKPLDFSLTAPPAVVAANHPLEAPAAPVASAAKASTGGLKQLNTRIPEATHRAFKVAAVKEGISVQDLLARLIDRHLAEPTNLE